MFLRFMINSRCPFCNQINISIMKYVKLFQTGDQMPKVGLGTWQAPADVVESTVNQALDIGYRHIDTAFNYNNEEAIGNAIKKWISDGKGAREDLFITTKLPHVGNRASDVKKFVEMQLKRLNLKYLDLYLIHVPFAFVCDPSTLTPIVKSNGEYELDNETNHIETWKVMEECQKEGLIRNLGLSNFNELQITKIMNESTIKPQVLQVELHAAFQQRPLRTFCEQHNIVLTAYAPLGSPGAKDHFVNKYNYSPEVFPDLLNLPEVTQIAEKYEKTSAQVLLHFLIQQNIVVIPKSTSEKRLKKGVCYEFDVTVCGIDAPKGADDYDVENIDIYDFELTQDEMDTLTKLDRGAAARIFNFLFWKGVEHHPEYPFKDFVPVKQN